MESTGSCKPAGYHGSGCKKHAATIHCMVLEMLTQCTHASFNLTARGSLCSHNAPNTHQRLHARTHVYTAGAHRSAPVTCPLAPAAAGASLALCWPCQLLEP
eukprot:scaffold159289_cov19-Tisochrysis_lutea.AAC.1